MYTTGNFVASIDALFYEYESDHWNSSELIFHTENQCARNCNTVNSGQDED
jgi:hypothetical protein